MIGVEAYENWNFNPRSREGSDLSENVYKLVQGDFNPRSREGSDVDYATTITVDQDFNPRSREGSDQTTTKAL